MIANLLEVLRYPLLDADSEEHRNGEASSLQERATETLDAIVADTEAIGLAVKRNKKLEIIGVEEVSPGQTKTIDLVLGQMGTIAYRDLSAVAHGGMSSLLDRMERVDSRGGTTLMGPGGPASHVASLGVVLIAFIDAQEKRIRLYGWDPLPPGLSGDVRPASLCGRFPADSPS